MIQNSKGKTLAAILLAAVLSACGSGGSTSATTPIGTVTTGNNLSGVAASGAPLAGATFTITGLTSGGVIATGTVENSGFYQTSLLADSAPYVIAVTDTSVSPAKVYKAVVLASDIGSTMNVTPITDMVANIALNDPTVLAAIASASSTSSTDTATALTTALTSARTGAITAVQTALTPLLTAYGVTDTGMGLLTHAFTPTVDAVDKVLDAFTSTCTTSACTIALKSAKATAALGSTALVIPTTSVALATTAASTVATSLSTTTVIASVQKVAPVVVVLRSISAWNVGTASAAYTGSISIYNFTDKDYSGSQVLYFESKVLQGAGFWNATAVTGNGKFQLTTPSWAVLPPAAAGGAKTPFVIGYSGAGSLADAIDLTSCNIGGQKCILMIDNGTLGTITAATGSTTDDATAAAASVRSWSSFVTSLPAAVLSNANSTTTTLTTATASTALSSANNGAAVAVPASTAATAATTTTATTTASVATTSTTTPATTTSTAATTTPAVSTAASAGVSVMSAWVGGFNGSLNLLNTSGKAWSAWTVSFDLPASVSNIGSWGNYLLTQSGSTVTFSNQPWNGVIASGSALSLGFGGTGSLTTSVSNCKLTYVSAGTTVTGSCNISSSAGTQTTTTSTSTAVPAPVATPTPTPTVIPTPVVTTTTTATTPATTTTAAVTTTTTTSSGTTGSTAEPTTMAGILSADQSKRVYVGYYPSWSDNWFNSYDYASTPAPLSNDALLAASKFARIPAVYTHIVAAFASPAFSYTAGAADWTGTGIQFSAHPQDIKAAIAVLHARNIKVLLAVGGASYPDWAAFSAEGNGTPGPITASFTAIMTDLGFDGLDVDYEIAGNNPTNNAEYKGAIKAMRNAVNAAGSGKVLALAGWSTGADCVSGGPTDVACNGAVSVWGDSAGRERAVFSDPAMAVKIDMLNIMSYDAQTLTYDGVKAWQLYRNLFPSTTIVSIGLETAVEGWAGGMLVTKSADAQCTGSTTLQDQFRNTVNLPYSVERYINHTGITTTHSNVRDGAMLWQIMKTATAACGSAVVASPGTIGAQISTSYGLPNDNSRAAWQ